jgi:diguanylate cyclase (GGDEF)-like protein
MLFHAIQPLDDPEAPAGTTGIEWHAYELSVGNEPRPRPIARIGEDSQGGTLLLELGGTHALLVAGSAIRRIPLGTNREDLLGRAATGAAAWEREQLRLLRRARLPDQLAELAGQLNRAARPDVIAKYLTESTARIVGGYRAHLLLRDREAPAGPSGSARFTDPLDSRIATTMHSRFTAPGIISAFEARPDLGMPFSELAQLFDDTAAAVVVHVPVGQHGILLLAERRQSRTVEPDDFSLMLNLAQLAEGALLRVYSVEEAHRLSLVDPLTGLANRRHMQVLMRHVWASARRGKRFAVILIDIDDFKGVNDSYGHLVGDRLLRDVAEVLQEEVRGSDLVVRYGGDEFLIVLPEEGGDGASALVRRIQARLGESIAISAGVAEYHPELASVDEMLEVADRKLYTMKRRRKKGSAEGSGLTS